GRHAPVPRLRPRHGRHRQAPHPLAGARRGRATARPRARALVAPAGDRGAARADRRARRGRHALGRRPEPGAGGRHGPRVAGLPRRRRRARPARPPRPAPDDLGWL
ncbi:MAG: hypothetical protein AVDCRST_MAG54-4937, partial [uncultured Actinomycetospora sp.]